LDTHPDLCDTNFPSYKEDVAKKLKIAPDGSSPFILLVESGSCTNVRKVRNAQQLGASAVIIANTEGGLPNGDDLIFLPKLMGDDGNNTPGNDTFSHEDYRLPDDGSGKDVSIPSMMIGKSEYGRIKKVIDAKKNSTGIVLAEMAWQVPKFENKVIMDLWYSPIDTPTKEFMASNFSAIARTFDLNALHGNVDDASYDERMNLLSFRERPILLDGKALGCIGTESCQDLCTNGGRYCHVPHRHTFGKDIVKESLRRLCIDKHYKNPKVYWDYIDQFSSTCWEGDSFANEDCVNDAYSKSNIDKSTIDTCINDSGDVDKDVENALLQASLEMQGKWGIHQSPTVMINHEVSTIVSWMGLNQIGVLTALCDTFSYGEKPHVCYACMHCGDPVACATRSPMQCHQDDGVEKEDPHAHELPDDGNHSGGGGKSRTRRVFHWIFSLALIGGIAGGAFMYYKKYMEERGDGLGSYSLQDAFLSG